MTRYYLYSLLLCLASFGAARGQGYIHQDFEWSPQMAYALDSTRMQVPYSTHAGQDPQSGIPCWTYKIPVAANQEVVIDPSLFLLLENMDMQQYGTFLQRLSILPGALKPSVGYGVERKQRYAIITLPAIEKDENGRFRILTHLTLKWTVQESADKTFFSKGPTAWKTESLLKEGDWVKIIFQATGVYRLTLQEIQGFGLNVSGQDVSKIRMYAYAGGMLPEHNLLTQYDDLEEMAIEVRDKNGNGLFDGDDDVLFFVYGSEELKFDPTSKNYYLQTHYYSSLYAAFITVGAPGGKRIPSVGFSNQAPTYTTGAFDEILHFEEDHYNLIKSGKEWYGKEFGRLANEHSFTFHLPGLVPGNVILQTRASARSGLASIMKATSNGQHVHTHSFVKADVDSYAGRYASYPEIQRSSVPGSSQMNVVLSYPKPTPDSRAWLDFVEVVYRKKLEGDGQFRFRDGQGVGNGSVTRYNLTGGGYEVWDLSDPLNIKRINLADGAGMQYFVAESGQLIEYVALKNENFHKVGGFEKMANQNIHGERDIDYIIVAHPEFLSEAKRLADFHTSQNGLKVLVVEPAKIYNEFSSGVPDISAIRNMVRYFYETATPGNEPRYLLLFGDASYDYKNILAGNTNFVPTFETDNSVDPVGSFCSDDFYGLLDEDEGASIVDANGKVDIGIGRLPVQTAEEARAMVDKIIHYHEPSGLGDWRNLVALVTDDQDGNVHLNDGETFSKIIETDYEEYNIRKLYADAYKQTTVGNGQRYPEIIKEIDRAFNDGALIVNYSGHGGETQLGEEKFVDVPQIQSWKGGNQLPLFITATCEFTRFDDPSRQSAGELVMLNPNGGAIGLLTTVRLVYSWPNRQLNANFYDHVFDYPPNETPALGDLFMATKNATSTSTNSRSFTLIGDPAMKLAYPKHKVVATLVNGQDPVTSNDTLKALSRVIIEGEIRTHQDQLMSGFNGKIYTTVFANKQKVKTLANDPESKVQEFEAYNSIAYKGVASVKNGIFRVEFILPRDLPFELGLAKISYYAENGQEDANGENFMVMSPELDPTAVMDNEGPKIRVFMNDSNFIFGGITNQNPYIYALVYDESGINTTGVGIGRDISGTLDYDSKKVIELNQYYQANTDDFTRGVIYYPLKNLSNGRHHLKVKVWDIHNNSAEGTTEFVVAPSVEFAIENLINYPNPFYSSTTFSFEHNKQGEDLYMELRIYDTQGKLVTTLSATEQDAGSRVKSLVWEVSEKGPLVSSGMYVFKLVVKTGQGEEVEKSSTIVYLANP